MYCSQCGSALQVNARFCSKCGHPSDSGAVNPLESKSQDKAIWNPNAAANWSILFTPAFGSFIQAINWRALGEEQKSKAMMGWFYASIALLFIYVAMGLLIPEQKAAEGLSRFLAFLFLVIWYFAVGRSQTKYVKAKFGKSYTRRPWGKPVLIGVFAITGYLVISVAVGAFVGLSNNSTVDARPDFSRYGTPVDGRRPDDSPKVREFTGATDEEIARALAKKKTDVDCSRSSFADLPPGCPQYKEGQR